MTMCSSLHKIGKCPYGGRSIYSISKSGIYKLEEGAVKCKDKQVDLEEFHSADLTVNNVDPREFISLRNEPIPLKGTARLILNGCQILAVVVGEIKYMSKSWVQSEA